MRKPATQLFLGKNPTRIRPEKVEGQEILVDGEAFYRIANSDRLRPFFLSVVSSSDLWMFISSNGALTAGRQNPDLALFPYYTDDRIHDAVENTGPKTVIICEQAGRSHLWEPFSERGGGNYRIHRNLLKNFYGNKILFEEINADLGLAFRYGWSSSEQFGWVRTATLTNTSSNKVVKVRLLDGLQNLLPCGIGSQFQLEKSTLIDAYKKNELIPDSGLGLFLLSSIPVDRPEPAESLRATTVFSLGIQQGRRLLSSRQIAIFRKNLPLRTETDIRAERGAYFIESQLVLKPGHQREWMLIADVDQGPSRVAYLRKLLRAPAQLKKAVETDIRKGTEELWRIVAAADGVQKTARPLCDARHFNNVLCNVMRGGIFPNAYTIDVSDLSAFVRQANRKVAARQVKFFRRLGKSSPHDQVLAEARASGDCDLERLCNEYLPLTFSRRHGDPSRPWNRFALPGKGPDGRRVLNYEGNWRDIFQNWEALAVSFPGFVSSMVSKFLNASTADGYNPYRVTRDGLDWEVHDRNDPWSHIGYWGDHQIIYLLKLMEILERSDPAILRGFLTRDLFSFANVPYRIRPFEQLLKNPRETVDFDPILHALTRERVGELGSDGKLLWDKKGQVCHVNLTEKLLISLLAKFANFIPGAGIWLNTQRPEWNDANNALVGNGVSMVTLYQLRRYLAFCEKLFRAQAISEIPLSIEVQKWLAATTKILSGFNSSKVNDTERARILKELGQAASRYRAAIYKNGFSGARKAVPQNQILEFFIAAIERTDETIRANRRPDGLYHSYNLADFENPGAIPIRRLYPMLEGQAAILGADFLSPKEALKLLESLKHSQMYRASQHSYLLYPDRHLPRFVEKNNLPASKVSRSPLFRKLIADGNRLLIEKDVAGVCHFHPKISNAADIIAILEKLSESGYERMVKRESKRVLEVFEEMFDHRSFTGRSGTFFGYEGLGSIYWHMVSKLRLAAQEAFFRGSKSPISRRLAECYHDVRAGIGDFKTPENYGAFPMDPYSHTPAHTGARQPGLTGQVKEDILCRFGELGVSVRAGCIHFLPQLLRKEEFLTSPTLFPYSDTTGKLRNLQLPIGSLAFTYCQVPVVYQPGPQPSLTINFADGEAHHQETLILDEKTSRSIFKRDGSIQSLVVEIPQPT